MKKVAPADGYPPEEGCYLRGNDYSPVAVVVILRWEREKTPPSIEQLVRVAVESGAALAGTLQTENIGLERMATTQLHYQPASALGSNWYSMCTRDFVCVGSASTCLETSRQLRVGRQSPGGPSGVPRSFPPNRRCRQHTCPRSKTGVGTLLQAEPWLPAIRIRPLQRLLAVLPQSPRVGGPSRFPSPTSLGYYNYRTKGRTVWQSRRYACGSGRSARPESAGCSGISGCER